MTCVLSRFAYGYRRHTGEGPQPPGLQISRWGPRVPISSFQFLRAPPAGLDVCGVSGDVPRWVPYH